MQRETWVLQIMQQVVRIGTVQAYDKEKRTARVKFHNMGGIVSAPLKVISRPRSITPELDGEAEHQTKETSLTYDRNDRRITEGHAHEAFVTDWNPKVNDMVLCIFYPGGGGDGFVIGIV